MDRKKTYVFPEIESYMEKLEIEHLRTKNHFVLVILFLMMAGSLVYMLLSGFPVAESIAVAIGFFLVILLNLAEQAYGKEAPQFFALNKYLTTIGIFSLTTVLIFLLKSPSVITGLFLAYAVSVFYQDLKVLFLASVMMLFTVFMIILNYPAFLNVENVTLEARVGVMLFFLALVLILFISSYIIVKQKRFFYHQIALGKEHEFRNIDLLTDLRKERDGGILMAPYFARTEAFLNAFCQKIGMEDVFTEKMEVLKSLEQNTPVPILLEKYPHYGKEDLERLRELLVDDHHKLRKIAIKIGQTFEIDVKKREIFSETNFKSFNHQTDNLEIKILSFVLFYATLKKGYAGLPALSEAQIYDILVHSDYYYYMEPRVIRIYQENSDVFDEIVRDAFGRKAKS